MTQQEHVVLVNGQGMHTGTMEKYAAHQYITPFISLSLAGFLILVGNICSHAVLYPRKPGPASGPIPCVDIHNGMKAMTMP